ncbi:hypothetical protein BDR26DRAFT_870352 [Obelidium mucronatum]|nr:hypothetical protein BDR26DRAFT_870352 [Obelidium mucronatum]
MPQLAQRTHDVVHETVAKIEALVDRAEDFLEHVDVGNTVHKIVESVNASETVHKIEELADTAEDFLESVETGVWNFMSSAISTSMGVLGGGTGTKAAVVPKANIIFDRKTATILALRRDATTYTVDPSALLESSSISDKELAERFKSFKGSFEISTYATQITRLLDEDSEVRAVLSKTVPSAITYDEFWTRYFFRVQEVDREEEARKKLMSDANLNDEEFAWDDDSEEEEKQQLPSPQQSEKHISVQKQQLKEDSKILGPVSISEAVAVVESNKATPTGQRHHPVVEELRENSSGSDSSSFDVVSDKPKGGVESLADSEIASVNSTDEEAAKGDKKEKEKVLGKEDEEEGEAADWDTWE